MSMIINRDKDQTSIKIKMVDIFPFLFIHKKVKLPYRYDRENKEPKSPYINTKITLSNNCLFFGEVC